ncbi:LpqB family beta-propeller domain-containing protein [Streptomyces sp. HUAS TT20]|uniref:LpqB family beta-propeller domain-containing protein n=1 Tax=Streptomyces sp. HUAS TT20 TaxID=3447509 RepID=UPI0021D8C4A4|nr:LpqB family beta-propeller domain-containing protein [Streptomyces sp. HUAS 15-9]UXY27932.1 LpqB family beta-propeller domain-containing protein [Streptomyces sp. HUAS 15-9]
MGADREGGARRRPVRAVAYAACGAVVLAGCASMPDSGDLRDVESTPRQDTQVRVFAMPPQDNAAPGEIVQGFLEALTSDDPHYDTARKYLTAGAARKWKPEQSTTVLANGPSTDPDHPAVGGEDTNNVTYTLAGSRVATVDAQQAYSPAAGPYNRKVHLTQDAKTKQWRIDALPEGVVMGKSDFQRNYTSVNKYYFASNTSDVSTGRLAAVADPVFVRKRVDPMTQMVRSLLDGPTSWLGPVVRSSFPTGTALKKGASSLTPDDQNKLTVPLNDKASRVGSTQCSEMATQLLFTLQNLSPTVDSVELQGADGKRLCDLGRGGAVAWRGSEKRPEYLYFLDSKHRLVRIASTSTTAVPVPGALGQGDRGLRSVAVSRDEHSAAGVALDGKSLYVTSLASGGSLGDPVVQSHGATADDRLTTPSWDDVGDLWVADRNPADPRLLLIEEGAGQPVEVRTPELPGRIKDVRVAADGVRIALVVEKDRKQSLLIGRIERDEKSGQKPVVSVLELRSATPGLEEVTAMSWAGDGRLVVVGREQGGVLQLRYIQVDGSTPDGLVPSALPGVKAIAASEDDRAPLVAYSDDGIVRLPSGGQWQTVVKEGSAPVYPG